MGRRRSAPSDSLDLLLDTICNTFGGILFIALLVVILLQLHVNESAATAAAAVTPEDLERLQADVAGRHADLNRLRDLLDGQQRTLESLAPPDLASLVGQHSAAVRRNTDLMQQREELLDEMAELTHSILRAEAELRTADTDLRNAQERVADIERQLAADRTSRRRELRTPVQRPSSTSEVGCVIQYGRFYVWHRYDEYGIRRGLNTDDFLVLEDSVAGAYTSPRPTAGIVLDGTARSQQEVMRRLSAFQPSSEHVAVIVRPDSFAEWPQLRDILTTAGFDYRLMPTDAAIVDRGAADSPVQ